MGKTKLIGALQIMAGQGEMRSMRTKGSRKVGNSTGLKDLCWFSS